jgi:hypothetical protein
LLSASTNKYLGVVDNGVIVTHVEDADGRAFVNWIVKDTNHTGRYALLSASTNKYLGVVDNSVIVTHVEDADGRAFVNWSFIPNAYNNNSSAFTIDEYGNTEFFGNVKIHSGLICSVPIGTIIDWWRPKDTVFPTPRGFHICDGHLVKDVDSPFNNMNVPNLLHKFIRGVDTVAEIGTQGGSDATKCRRIFTEPGGAHTHNIKHTNGIINNDIELCGLGKYSVCNESGDTAHNSARRIWVGGGSAETMGQHRHGITMPWDGNHQHEVIIEDVLPPYYGLLKLIRIK